MQETTIQPSPMPTEDRKKEDHNFLVFSYLTMRNLIGICGICLPVVLFLTTRKGENDKWIENSISDYYYSNNGDILVVLLSVLGVFLFTYKGYKWQEDALTTIAAICGIGIAFSPTATHAANSLSIHVPRSLVPKLFGIERHAVFTIIFFVSLSVISLIYFPKSDVDLKSPAGRKTQKAKRNIVYRICGWIMILCIVSLGLYVFVCPVYGKDLPVIFIIETVAIWAFGISWITKGETLWPDGQHYLVTAYHKVTASLTGRQSTAFN